MPRVTVLSKKFTLTFTLTEWDGRTEVRTEGRTDGQEQIYMHPPPIFVGAQK